MKRPTKLELRQQARARKVHTPLRIEPLLPARPVVSVPVRMAGKPTVMPEPPWAGKTNRNCPMRQLSVRPESLYDFKEGDYFIRTDTRGVTWMDVALPGKTGEPTPASLPLMRAANSPQPIPWRRGKDGALMRFPTWTWNGDVERPTLTPSIKHGEPDDQHYWHGFVFDGQLVGCKEKLT